ncbi:hypothetical protein JOL79_30675 [Microbispora sp. RL4-1S]|uniref:Uncharacterized protein n=1 Tax=Microbispora oryzae TaxID=2806554 RepID=A0A940WQL9_9ACTN|nr:hypothetical protein [Microbispora oryzae]MBP2708152.1 hypothetical protein [Microbispora oryzae]
MFLLPGESKVAERLELIERNLAVMCTYASQRGAGVWRLTNNGAEAYNAPARKRRRSGR